MDRKQLVARGYDQIAERYLASKGALGTETAALLAALDMSVINVSKGVFADGPTREDYP